MEFHERLAVRFLFRAKLAELHGQSFQDFFDSLMSAASGTNFVDVRTAGTMGDLGADGLLIAERVLYACYAPEVFDFEKVTAKFSSDLQKAKLKRGPDFDEFVFVHNDLRGVHPAISQSLTQARDANKGIAFRQMGFRALHQLLVGLTGAQAEDVLGAPLPIREMTYGLILEDIAPVLQLLKGHRLRSDTQAETRPVPFEKLEYNSIEDELREQLVTGMKYSPIIEKYYAASRDELELDEVANAFKQEYIAASSDGADPEIVVWRLEQYVAGNASQTFSMRRSVMAVIAYFFASCHIFEEPDAAWLSARAAAK